MKEDHGQDFWFTSVLNQGEAALTAKSVPRCYWGYILSNGVPGTEQHDGLGAIYTDREDIVARLLEIPDSSDMGVTVVDGRDLDVIRKWIGGRDWTEDVVNSWSKSMMLLGIENLSVQTN